jgi:hypothetical protein
MELLIDLAITTAVEQDAYVGVGKEIVDTVEVIVARVNANFVHEGS